MPDKSTILKRPQEISRDFKILVDQHIADMLQRKATKKFHAVDFAALLYIDSRHLTNTIKQETGMSTCDIVENRVISEANKLLKDSNLSIASIGALFFYNDATNFTKFYKGMTGETPSSYRKRQLKRIS